MTLQPFQYKLGNVVFGKDTDIIVQSIDMQPYNVNNQDFQLPRSDEVRFGVDTLAPSPIIFTLGVLNNYVLDSMEALTHKNVDDSLLASSRAVLSELSAEWKANSVRSSWGAMKPLLFCDNDGVVRRIYGRPGKFAYAASKRGHSWIDAQAEFRRADTYAYNDVETYAEVLRSDNPLWVAQEGDAPAWMRILLYGPIDHPVITLGQAQIEIDVNIPDNCVVEVSSYPWMRRAIDSNGLNLRTKIRGNTTYLDEIRFPAGEYIPIRWTDANSEATWTELPNTRWVENVDFLDLFTLWSTYQSIHGQVFWAGNVVSGGYVSAPLGTGAAIDAKHQYTSPGQFAQVRIANDTRGNSALVIASNDTMTNFAAVEVDNNYGILNQPDYLRLKTGTAHNNMTTRATYEIPDKFNIHDTVGIRRDPITKRLTMIHNGIDRGFWNDSGGFINDANRRQGFIINTNNTIDAPGCGFDNLVAYDITTAPKPSTGRCYVLWRDAYHVA